MKTVFVFALALPLVLAGALSALADGPSTPPPAIGILSPLNSGRNAVSPPPGWTAPGTPVPSGPRTTVKIVKGAAVPSEPAALPAALVRGAGAPGYTLVKGPVVPKEPPAAALNDRTRRSGAYAGRRHELRRRAVGPS